MEIKEKRCFKPKKFGKIKEYSLHHFSDASKYGCGKIHCRPVTGKIRVITLKYISRFELRAATLSIKMPKLLMSESQFDVTKEVFWSDIKVVFSYIKNQKPLVANRQKIKGHSNVVQCMEL